MISVPIAGSRGRGLRGHFDSRRGDMVRLLKKLVRLESPTGNKAAVDRCAAAAVSFLHQAGLNVRRIPAASIGDLYLIDLNRKRTPRSTKPLLLLVHSDTVWPVGTIARRPFKIRGDRMFGPGALDMKAGLVQACFALQAIRRLRLEPRRPVRLIMNSAEETGSPVSRRLIRAQAAAAEAALCLEPSLPGGALKTRRKGRLVLSLETRGKAAHAGSPRAGVNALEELCRQLLGMRRLRRGGTTVNIGRIEGGRAANVVADRASALVDVRFWNRADKSRVLEAVARAEPVLPGAQVTFRVLSDTPPLERTDASRRLFLQARRLAARMDVRLTAGKTGGGSDASLISDLGLPILDGLGPDGDGIHAENEHVLLSSLVERTALLAVLLLEL